MFSLNWLQENKRLFLISIICAALAINFWAGSRVPSLSDKATLGGDLILEDPLGFEAAYPVDPVDPIFKKIFFTTLNWISTNQQGMTFGILIAAGFMTLLSLLQKHKLKSHIGNSLLGLFIGIPLGVCVNCAAPIARGLHESGTRLETTLVTMISSPTLNIIVLTMLFSLLPLYMAVTKIIMTLLFLLLIIPLLARYVFKNQLTLDTSNLERGNQLLNNINSKIPGSDICEIATSEPSWLNSAKWVTKKYTFNLIYIIKLTVPLMLLAGIMGSIAIIFFPWQEMTDLFNSNPWYILSIGTLLIAIVGLFLPVPIAFDVAIVTALLASGMPPIYAMTLLFTLGIFSVYSFFIIWTGISKKLAIVLSMILLTMGIFSGVIVEIYLKWDESRQQELFQNFDLGDKNNPISSFFFTNAWAEEIDTGNETVVFSNDIDGISITETKLNKSSPPADKMFTRLYGEELGLKTETDVPVGIKFMPPFQRSWPVASADINSDGWLDIVFGTDKGIFLFKNIEGNRFEQLQLEDNINNKKRVINLALIDMNNDKAPDLFMSLYRGGNHIIFNREGKFLIENLISLPELNSTALNATAFGDLDLDGDIDIAAGNWSTGDLTRRPGETSRNAILWNNDDNYTIDHLPGLPGETLSILISDINQDSFPDLLVGNDFQIPEFYYLGQGNGKLQLIKNSDKIFNETTFSTMSIDSGDIDNDLDLEIYTTQATGFTSTNPTNRASMLPLKTINATCDEFENIEWKERCLTRIKYHNIIFQARIKRNPHLCLKIESDREKKSCLAFMLLQKATRFDKNLELCDRLNRDWEDFAYICKLALQTNPKRTGKNKRETLRQKLGRNMLYTQTKNGSFKEFAENMDADITGWSWTAKFADLNNDEWQDLYVVNGRYPSQKRATKVFFKNEKGKRFSNETRETGLENYLGISSYTYIDYDNDADLDIVATSHDGPIWVYINNTQHNTGIVFELNDKKGNRTGIGSRIIIRYGDDEKKHQIREIKASGGFLSYDAPLAYFGLGENLLVSRVEVIWSTGETSNLIGDFKAGYKYLIEREY